MSIYQYRTIKEASTSLVKERNSKFYGFAFPVGSDEEIAEHLKQLRNKYPDATHHCYAYALGLEGEHYRWSDDGEPGNSAGRPIYRRILSAEITNVLIVVVRYYGGKKLGVPGLIQAYEDAAEACLPSELIILKEVERSFKIKTQMNKAYEIYSFAAKYGIERISSHEHDDHLFTLFVKESIWPQIKEALKELPNFELQDL